MNCIDVEQQRYKTRCVDSFDTEQDADIRYSESGLFEMRRWLSVCAAIWVLAAAATAVEAQQLILQQSDGWRYTTVAQPVDWHASNFDANAWISGQAPLGFGEAALNSITNRFQQGENVPITTYFRYEFQADATCQGRSLRMKIRVDDGFVAYLNGSEIQRWNMPDGIVAVDTRALKPLSAPEEQLHHIFDLSSSTILPGKNLLAIEVHQINNQSTDLYLEVQLSCHSKPNADSVQTSEDAFVQSLQFNSIHTINETTTILEGFIDGGRGMQIDEFGFAVSDREILRVDRSQDLHLQKHLEYARSAELANLLPVDRATRLARYVDTVTTPADGRNTCVPRSEYLAQTFRSREVYLGDIIDLCGAGVCRHRALLFKVLADEAGLRCALVRGAYRTSQGPSGHTWNELILDDGKRVIVDVMNIQPDYYFPTAGEPSTRNYLTVAGSTKYAADQRE